MSIGRFYAMVGVLLRRQTDGKYLVMRRSAEKDYGGGGWECITGRVDQGEGFEEAVHREVHEELGVEVTIDFIVGTTHFYRGEPQAENEMVGVQYCGSMKEEDVVALSWEHSEYRWVTLEEAEDMLPQGHWLVEVIRRAETIRKLLPEPLAAYYRDMIAPNTQISHHSG